MRVRFLPPAIFLGCLVACRIAAQQDSFAITQALASNEFERALQLVSSKLKTNAVDPRLWTLRGMALNGLGNTKEGLASFRRALRYQGDYLPALLGKAEIEYRTGLPEARATLRRILTANPELATAHAMVGVLEFERNNHTQAAAHFEKAGDEISRNPLALWQYGQSLYLSGQPQQAAKIFAALLGLEPENSSARFNLALAHYESGRWQDAVETLRPLADLPSPGGDVLRLYSTTLERIGKTEDAVRALRRAIELYPQEEENYLDLASLCIDHQSYELGLEILDIGLRHITKSSRLMAARGIYAAQLGKTEDAERDLLAADALEPSKQYGKMGLTVALLDSGDTAASIRLLRGELGKNPADSELAWLLAEALIRTGAGPETPDFREARMLLENSIRANPKRTEAKALLGKLLLRSGERTKAIALLEAVLRQDPGNRTALYQLSQALRQAGRVAEAQQHIARLRGLMDEENRLQVERNRIRLVKAAPARELAH